MTNPSSPQDGWRPIAEARQDGTEYLLFGQRGAQIDIGSWCGCGAYRAKTKVRPAYFERAWGHGSTKFHPQPTHFMPLPATPCDEAQ